MASSASRLETRTGDGGVGELDVIVGMAGVSSERDGEMLRSPALSLLMLLSPILYFNSFIESITTVTDSSVDTSKVLY